MQRRGNIFLSKSKIKQGFQCVKSLYLQTHQSQLAREVTVREKQLFEQGRQVQEEAQKKFSGGRMIQAPYWDFKKASQQTQEALKSYPYIYEATFMTEELVVRVDILEVQDGFFNIYEVKSSTQVKEDHVLDCAIQKYILNQCGYEVEKCCVVFMNTESADDLFKVKDISDRVSKLENEVHEKVEHFKQVLSQKTVPQVDIGPYCKRPYECRFMEHCWKHIKKPSVFDIPSIGEQGWEFYQQNKIDLKDIPDEEFTDQQKMYQRVHLTNQPCIQKDKILKEVSNWKKPFYYLDFETLSSPIPYLEGIRPYQDIPFQFHCLKQNKGEESFREESYLHTSDSDPRRALVEKLVQFIEEEGSVLAYYKNFESRQLKDLAKCFPEFEKKLLSIESRLEDPLPLLREAVYFKEFNSSWSLKKVAPVLIGEKGSYLDLDVQDGLEAQRIFKKMIFLKDEDPQKEILRKNLIQYCRRDTVCLAQIAMWLFKQVE